MNSERMSMVDQIATKCPQETKKHNANINFCQNGKVDILGIKIDKITGREAMEKIDGFLNSESQHYIITANAEIIVAAQKDRKFREIINQADLALPDGFGPILASRIFSKSGGLKERIAGVDLIYRIANNFNNPIGKKRFFFLGARQEGAKLAAQKIKKNFPHIEIAGFFGGDALEEGDRVAVSIINQARPDILFAAYGAPRQEKWIARNLKKLPTVRLAMGVGGAFEIISGRIKRAPRWMRNAGLEWLWRLAQEPRRIGRIYNATIKFSWLVLTKKVKILAIL